MVTEKYILKNDPVSTEPTFFKLKEEGIRILQDLAANHWTDFNLHDPGVTILEQLCYALTELIFKSGFNVEDYLVDAEGRIDYKRLALYQPKEIFPSIAITLKDYRKLLFDCSTDLVDLWISPVKNKNYSGLYSLVIQPRNRFLSNKKKIDEIVKEVKKSYNRNRNLGEDLHEIKVAKVKFIELVTDIEISNAKEPESIMAYIYFSVSRFLNPGITYHSFEEIADQGMPYDEILNGPLLEHGWINDYELIPVMKTLFNTDLMQVIDKVTGVISVSSLSFVADGKEYSDEFTLGENDTVPILSFPGTVEEIRVTLRKDNRKIKINVKKMQSLYWKLVSQRWDVYNSRQNPDSLFEFPKGDYYKFSDYYSIQRNFPLNYGINDFGVAPSEPERRKIQAKQLKAYLLVFEQLLANYLEQISHIKDLYSIDESIHHTYFFQTLTDIPNIEGLYLQDSPPKGEIGHISSGHDHYFERRNRFLDYLLSLYGEDFKQKALRRYNYYQDGDELDQVLIDNKIAFLKSLVTVNKYRSKSFNYLEPSWNTQNISGLKHKVMILLGIRNFEQVSYSDTFLKWGFRLISEQMPDQAAGYIPDTELANVVVNKEYIESHFTHVPPMEVPTGFDFEEITELIKTIEIFRSNTILDNFLRYGVALENFKVGNYEDSKNVIAVFWHPLKNEWQYVSSFKDIGTAQESINRLRKFLILLNQDSEGLHIVENILLRPRKDKDHYIFGITGSDGKELFSHHKTLSFEKREEMIADLTRRIDEPGLFRLKKEGEDTFRILLVISEEEILESKTIYATEESGNKAIEEQRNHMLRLCEDPDSGCCFTRSSIRGHHHIIPDDFYSHRISVIFPDWTSRFHNSKFRMLAEETVSGNAPAHLFPEYYWLNPENMEKFEMLYRIWLNETVEENLEKLETAAANLVSFLLEHERSGNIYT